jgi:hypothetical protein
VVWVAATCVALGIAAIAALVRPGADPDLAWVLGIAAPALPLLTVQHLA